MNETFNVASLFVAQARRAPEQVALIVPDEGDGARTSYDELLRRCASVAHELRRSGIRRGDRVCVFVRPGVEWVAIVYSLFAVGAVPALIDPAMGRAGVVRCIEKLAPRALIALPIVHALRWLHASAFRSVEVALAVRGPMLGARRLRSSSEASSDLDLCPTTANDEAAVLFTSGSTGPAKGVVYTHAMFRAQVAALRELYGMREGDIDFACFAPFALFGPALGLTTVLAPLDFSHPGRCDPARVARAIERHRPVQTFGSPAVWKRVAPWCTEHGIKLASLRRLMIAGAPVSPRLIDQCLAVLSSEADVHTPYGATEALPIASAIGREIVGELRARTEGGEGNCVGRLAPNVEARVIAISDAPIESWSEALLVAPGEPGELVVAAQQVTRSYWSEPDATAAAKIRDGERVWHRMGDLVRVDTDERIWFLGRKSHRLETANGVVFPVPVENVFNTHDRVRRSALVGVGARGSEHAVLIVECEPGRAPRGERERSALADELLRLRERAKCARSVERVLFHDAFPVDVRHNAKIDRPALKRWAEERVR